MRKGFYFWLLFFCFKSFVASFLLIVFRRFTSDGTFYDTWVDSLQRRDDPLVVYL